MSFKQEENVIKPVVDLEEPTEDLIIWAKENIKEDPDKRLQFIADFREFIFAKGECVPHTTDDDYLLRFLRARHFIIPKAHRLMVNYYDFKESNPQYFQNINLDRIRTLAKTDIISVPPYRDQLGRRMMILRLGLWNPSEFTVDEIFQLTIGLLEMALLEPQSQIKGCVLIVDLNELSISQAWHMTPTVANHIVRIATTCFPLRVEGVHILHQSWIFDMAFNMIRPLVNEAVRNRILFYGDDLETFHSYVDPKYLPTRYGGIHVDYPVDMWFEDCIKYDDRLIQELVKLGYKEVEKLAEKRTNVESNLL